MCMWQSQAFGGALSFGSYVPVDQATVSACPAVASNPLATMTVAPIALRKPRRVLAPLIVRSSLWRGGDPLTGGQNTSGAGGFKIAEAGPARRRDDPGNVRAEDRQELRLEPGIALEPGVVAPGGMGHGHETRVVG